VFIPETVDLVDLAAIFFGGPAVGCFPNWREVPGRLPNIDAIASIFGNGNMSCSVTGMMGGAIPETVDLVDLAAIFFGGLAVGGFPNLREVPGRCRLAP
jgi:hypothetical protein